MIQEWDIWIEQGDKPWLRRTSTKLKGPKDNTELNVLNNFSDWKENPKFAANAFAFVPPQGATEIKLAENLQKTPPPNLRARPLRPSNSAPSMVAPSIWPRARAKK